MKTDVICDTNVWYYLGNGSLDPEQFADYNLIATFYNFEELITSYGLLKNFESIRLAANAIVSYSSKQILENGFLYTARLVDPYFEDTRYSYNVGIRHWNEIRAIAKQDQHFKLTKELEDSYRLNIDNSEAIENEVTAQENRFVEEVRERSKKLWKNDKAKYFKIRFAGIIHEFNAYLKEFSYDRIQLQPVQAKAIEFFLGAFLQFSRNTEVARWVVQPNDTIDLYNLIYTKPGTKYLTFESRWNRVFSEAGLSHYLLQGIMLKKV